MSDSKDSGSEVQALRHDDERLAAIQEENAFLAAVVSGSDDAIVSKLLDGTVRTWNAGAERLFGYTAEEMVGQPIYIIVPPERHAEERELLQRLSRGERIEHFETVRRAKSGRLVDVSLTISPIRGSDGRLIGASKIARDITERKRTDEALREASRQKDLFLAMLGHELRNPLAAIRHATSLLQSGKGNEALVARTHAILERQGRHMGALIDGLLDLSRIGEGRIHLQLEPVDLVDVCRVSCADVQVRSPDRQLTYTTHLPSAPVYVEGDRTRLTQIVDNLLSNAVQHTPDGGRVDLAIAGESDHVTLTVRDTGAGIEPADLAHIFEAFRQGPESSSRTHGGLGLGLALVRSLVELHRGEVQASSGGLGRGAEFVVRLPLTARRPAAKVVSRQDARPRSILIIEDNEDASDMLRELLTFQGHRVRVAVSGEEGVAAFQAERPDVVLCDLGLPGALSGFAVARALRDGATAGNVRLVAVSGFGLPEDKAKSAEAGFDEHLTKPIDLDALARVLGADPVAR